MTPMVEIQNLTKRFGDITAVDSLTLQVSEGELFGFLGPNAAGKTTTIKLLTGLLRPTSGRAFIGGHDLRMESLEAKRIIGYIPDHPYLYEKLTAREFLAFVASLYGVSQRESNRRIEDLLRLFELTSWADELIESFSHGMRQRLVMSGAFIHRPKVIVVDEPMVGLDPKSARMVKEILREMCRRGMTVFMSTHTLEIAEAMCDKIGIIKEGRLIALGTIDELRKMASRQEASLEEIFLELTGGTKMAELVEYLRIERG